MLGRLAAYCGNSDELKSLIPVFVEPCDVTGW